MEIDINLQGAVDSDSRREHGIQAPQQCLAGDGASAVEVGDHGVGVHTSIGATSAMEEDFLTGHHFQARLDFPLDGSCVGLSLPAAKVRAIIADFETDGADWSWIFH